MNSNLYWSCSVRLISWLQVPFFQIIEEIKRKHFNCCSLKKVQPMKKFFHVAQLKYAYIFMVMHVISFRRWQSSKIFCVSIVNAVVMFGWDCRHQVNGLNRLLQIVKHFFYVYKAHTALFFSLHIYSEAVAFCASLFVHICVTQQWNACTITHIVLGESVRVAQ